MLRITLRQLEIFVAIAQVGTVTEAADVVGLTQSAASMALGELERQINAKLFDRNSKRLALNENGRLIYHKALELIDRARELEAVLGPHQNLTDLRLGASSTIGNYMMPQLMGKFIAAHPGSRLSLKVGNTHTIISALKRFEIDVAFIEGPSHDRDIEALFWREEELAICAPPDHPLADRNDITVKELLESGWILREQGSGTREVVENFLLTQVGVIQIVLELGGTEAIKSAVESNLGISCLPKIALRSSMERGTLICLSTPSLDLRRKLFIIMNKDKYQTQGLKSFLSYCQETE